MALSSSVLIYPALYAFLMPVRFSTDLRTWPHISASIFISISGSLSPLIPIKNSLYKGTSSSNGLTCEIPSKKQTKQLAAQPLRLYWVLFNLLLWIRS